MKNKIYNILKYILAVFFILLMIIGIIIVIPIIIFGAMLFIVISLLFTLLYIVICLPIYFILEVIKYTYKSIVIYVKTLRLKYVYNKLKRKKDK